VASISAYWIAAVRARETRRTDQLFSDPFAENLAGERGVATMTASERQTGGENVTIPVRVRWFDDVTNDAVAAGIRQVVMVGAGLDTRPYRLDVRQDVDWFELDRAEVLSDKESVLADAVPRCRRHAVSADLSGDWAGPLRQAGLDTAEDTLWLAEGLFFYLTEDMATGLLRQAAALCGAGSRFVADVVGTAGLDSAAMRPYRDWCARSNLPPPFGHDDPGALVASGGWALEHITAPGAPDADYGRMPPQPAGLRPGRTHFVIGAPGDRSSA
jgi:methyltransferase (TIGR00027 family)